MRFDCLNSRSRVFSSIILIFVEKRRYSAPRETGLVSLFSFSLPTMTGTIQLPDFPPRTPTLASPQNEQIFRLLLKISVGWSTLMSL